MTAPACEVLLPGRNELVPIRHVVCDAKETVCTHCMSTLPTAGPPEPPVLLMSTLFFFANSNHFRCFRQRDLIQGCGFLADERVETSRRGGETPWGLESTSA